MSKVKNRAEKGQNIETGEAKMLQINANGLDLCQWN